MPRDDVLGRVDQGWVPGATNPMPASEALLAEYRLPSGGLAPTDKQHSYIEALRRHLNLPTRMLSDHCVATFGVPFADLDRRQASTLIDVLAGWEDLPDEFRKAQGQIELPGLGGNE